MKCEQNRNEQCVRDLCSRAVSLNTADTPSTPLQSKHFFKKPFSWIITCLSVLHRPCIAFQSFVENDNAETMIEMSNTYKEGVISQL